MAHSNKQHFVVINGRRISAQNGQPLDSFSPINASQPQPVQHVQPRFLDAISAARARPAAIATPQAAPVARPTRSIDGLNMQPAQPNHLIRHVANRPLRPRKPVTAHAIHQKAPVPAHRAKVHHEPLKQAVVMAPRPHLPAADHSHHKLPASAQMTEARLQRATMHGQSQKISKFGRLPFSAWAPQAGPAVQLPVAPVDEEANPAEVAQNFPAILPRFQNINQHIVEHHIRTQQQTHDQETATTTTKRLRFLTAFFDSQRKVSIAASFLCLAIIVGYVAYLNAPNMALRLAAARAGIEAQLPRHQPSGFAINGPIQYSPGEVTVYFKANADQRSFALTQRQSTWDSGSLLENYVNEKSNSVETVEKDGLKIYVYNGSNAAWVNKGTMYTIEGDSLLDSNQLASIAASL